MFEVRFEDPRQNRKYFIRFEGEGLRYELAAFLRLIHGCRHEMQLMSRDDSLFIADVTRQFRDGRDVEEIN